MKWLVIIFLLFVAAVLVTARYRRQINAAIVLWKSLVQGNSSASEIRSNKKDEPKAVELIKCNKCGSWTPQANSLSLNSGEQFCSTECIEQAILVKKKTAF